MGLQLKVITDKPEDKNRDSNVSLFDSPFGDSFATQAQTSTTNKTEKKHTETASTSGQESIGKLISCDWKTSTFPWFLVYLGVTSMVRISLEWLGHIHSYVFWGISSSFGIFFTILATKQTKEILGCVREAQIILISIIFSALLFRLPYFSSVDYGWKIVSQLVLNVVVVFITLFLPLNIIWKHERYNKKIRVEIQSKKDGNGVKLSYPKLKEYLNGSGENYHEFKEFLAQCFALENTFF